MAADPLTQALQRAREAEKEQALFYRALAAEAEERGEEAMSERLHALHADEQHHLSRLTARLLELGLPAPDLSHIRPPRVALDAWEENARQRENDEIERYRALHATEMDGATAALVEQILETERHHVANLGGKWTPA